MNLNLKGKNDEVGKLRIKLPHLCPETEKNDGILEEINEYLLTGNIYVAFFIFFRAFFYAFVPLRFFSSLPFFPDIFYRQFRWLDEELLLSDVPKILALFIALRLTKTFVSSSFPLRNTLIRSMVVPSF